MRASIQSKLIQVGESERLFWLLLAGSAILAGVYFRLLGFYRWPLATDEYYSYRGVAFILSSWLPEFPCGGYYSRGVMLQYLTAPLLLLGLAPEASLRIVSIASSLAMLPAAYLLAFRLGGLRAAVSTVVILSLSTWEIEMARFGRMYAPFQALFVWYVYHAYHLVDSGDTRRWRWLLGLSFFAPLVWMGGVLLGLLNFLPVLMRRSLWYPRHLCLALAILVGYLMLLSVNFRYVGETDGPPAALSTPGGVEESSVTWLLGPTLLESTSLAVAFFTFTAILGISLLRSRKALGALFFTSIVVVTAAMMLNQVLLAVLLMFGAFAVGWLRPDDTWRRETRGVFLPLLCQTAIWALVSIRANPDLNVLDAMKILVSFPDLIYSLAYPWLMSMPLMTVLLVFGTAVVLVMRVVQRSSGEGATDGIDLLLALVIVSVTVVGGAQALYNETRYSFHLYPVLIALTLFGVTNLAARLPLRGKAAPTLAPLACLLWFGVSSDSIHGHTMQIDSYEANFRVGYENRRARHYYPRFDFRTPADYVNDRAGPSDLVVATNVVLTHYLNRTTAVYMSTADSRYRGQACNSGRTERWTGMPLLDEISDIEALSADNPESRSWLIADRQTLNDTIPPDYLTSRNGYELAFVSEDAQIRVYERAPGAGAPEAQ